MRLSYLACVIIVIGCGDEGVGAPGTDGTGTESTTSTTMTASATMPGSSGADTSGGSTDGSSSSSPGETTEAADESTAAPGECDFEASVDMVIQESTVEPIDCGQVTPSDDGMAWLAAHDCARDATLDQLPYKVLWQYDDAGTLRDAAFASEVGEVYAIYRFDDDAAEGTTSITFSACNGISTPNDCAPMAGQICIVCLEPGKPAELCD
jgi:hypothetical protein